MKDSKILIAADHAGFLLKQILVKTLIDLKYQVIDLGCHNEELVDYPDYAQALCKEMDDNHRGILVCGSGIGMSMAANRFKHIRAALCINANMARMSREHNDANILVLGARIIDKETALACLNEFLLTEFKGEKHKVRVDKL